MKTINEIQDRIHDLETELAVAKGRIVNKVVETERIIFTTRQLNDSQIGDKVKFEKATLCYTHDGKVKSFEKVEGIISEKLSTKVIVISTLGHTFEVPFYKNVQTNDFN